MSKKGENIYKRKDGRWEGRYIKQRTPTKKIIYGYVYGKKYSEVKEKLIFLKAKQLVTQETVISSHKTYQDWIIYWLNNTVRRTVKATTYSNYFRLLSKHILPTLGEYHLAKITSALLQEFVDGLLAKNLANSTIRLIFTIVNKSLKEAVKNEYLDKNPCNSVHLPKHTVPIIHSLSSKEQRKLEELAFRETECSPIILALYSGMRIGEISGLKWEDIDFDKGLIRVHRTISRIIDEHSTINKTELISGSPKTAYSSRVIPLATNLKDYLLEKKETSPSEYVIHCRGKLAEPRVINYRFKRMIRETEFASIHFHVLRHTFATRCLEQGVDIVSLSRILGHRSTKLTLDTYADSLLEHRQEVMKAVDALLKKPPLFK
ncbi:tyrosine-type recombinase/integrase [Enterococcus wangshanyuanii]|uniref:Site-specific integrase n=1 Tax=Enterococcus wangshanyuanii TaxID=2005703 RepID=A0ABQ1NL46_9ENTE|nr:site-specific integrase [Enterococcus wangshanyuanii]GGC76853.1 site-specific integrase [Enterococcus wangshanyuanii]